MMKNLGVVLVIVGLIALAIAGAGWKWSNHQAPSHLAGWSWEGPSAPAA
jgi:hypothetical protein